MKGRASGLDNVSGNSLRSDERSAVTRPEIAAVERRKARLPPLKRQAGRLRKMVPLCFAPDRRSASLRGGKKGPGESPEKRTRRADVRGHGPRGAEEVRADFNRRRAR
jgi:hypothetical protein